MLAKESASRSERTARRVTRRRVDTSAAVSGAFRPQYEDPFTGADGNTWDTAFTIIDNDTGETYLWEYLGMLHVEVLPKKWEKKLAWYRSNGVDTDDNGGGPNGTLITTEDSPAGGISSVGIAALVVRMFG